MIRRSTWDVLLVFAILLAVAFLWQRSQDQKSSEATPTVAEASERQFLFDIAGEVASLRIEHVGEKTIELVKDENGQWIVAGSPASVIDSASVEAVVGQLSTLPLVSSLQNIPQLQDLGLEPPSYRILVIQKDGKQLVASVGDATPTGSGYYVLASDRRVYIANEFSLQTILDLVDKPLPTPYPAPAGETPASEEAVPGATKVP
jgi:hypothetical protein